MTDRHAVAGIKQCSLRSLHESHQWAMEEGDELVWWDCEGSKGVMFGYSPSSSPKAELLEEALSIVTGPRQQLYGHPSQNFIDTARLMTAYLQARGLLGDDQRLEPYDVPILIDCLKTARIATSPLEKDHWVDKAGYAACGYEAAVTVGVAEVGEEKAQPAVEKNWVDGHNINPDYPYLVRVGAGVEEEVHVFATLDGAQRFAESQ